MKALALALALALPCVQDRPVKELAKLIAINAWTAARAGASRLPRSRR